MKRDVDVATGRSNERRRAPSRVVSSPLSVSLPRRSESRIRFWREARRVYAPRDSKRVVNREGRRED